MGKKLNESCRERRQTIARVMRECDCMAFPQRLRTKRNRLLESEGYSVYALPIRTFLCTVVIYATSCKSLVQSGRTFSELLSFVVGVKFA